MGLTISQPFDSADHIFELKMDGIRAIAYLGENTELISRNDNDVTDWFANLKGLHKHVRGACVLDGEIIVQENGRPSFARVMERRGFAQFVAFDILELNGERLTGLPLMKRKSLLQQTVDESEHIIISRYIEEHGIRLFETAKKGGLEGIVAKRKISIYKEGKKTNDWQKIKVVNGRGLTNPDKVLFPDTKTTKGELAEYYRSIAGRMLPYVLGRNLSLVVCPQGVGDSCFYKKNSGDGVPLLPVSDIDDLLGHVQNNAIEFHLWGAKNGKPDVMVFDLDPDEAITPEQVRQGVKDLKGVLDTLGLVSFLKTSGNKGYHVVVPMRGTANWEAFTAFAKTVAEVMEKKWPHLYTTNVRKDARRGKIFIDWIRNSKGHTSIAPYSVRAKAGARVSMPIGWGELGAVAPNAVTMLDAIARCAEPDPWKDFFVIKEKQGIK